MPNNKIIQLIEKGDLRLESLNDILRDDNDIVMAAVRFDESQLKFASERLKNDEEVVSLAVSHYNSGNNLEHASARLRNHKGVVLAAVRHFGFSLKYASVGLRNDREVVLAAVAQTGTALYFASPALQSDREVVLEATRNNGLALRFSAAEYQEDRELALVAATSNPTSLEYMNKNFSNDEQIVSVAVGCLGHVLEYASKRLRNDIGVVKIAVKSRPLSLQYASNAVREDHDIILTAIENDPPCIEFALGNLPQSLSFIFHVLHKDIRITLLLPEGSCLQFNDDTQKKMTNLQRDFGKYFSCMTEDYVTLGDFLYSDVEKTGEEFISELVKIVSKNNNEDPNTQHKLQLIEDLKQLFTDILHYLIRHMSAAEHYPSEKAMKQRTDITQKIIEKFPSYITASSSTKVIKTEDSEDNDKQSTKRQKTTGEAQSSLLARDALWVRGLLPYLSCEDYSALMKVTSGR